MTVVRGVLIACAVLALADGELWEAVGLAAFVLVLVVAAPGGVAPRPRPFRVWWFWRS